MQLIAGEDLHNAVRCAPVGICILNADTLVAEVVNGKFLEVAGKPYESIFGQFYWDAFAEARPYYEAALASVIQTGVAYYADEVELMLIRHGREEMIFVTFVYSPVQDKAGKLSKVAVWVLENTKQVAERVKVEAARAAFQQERDRLNRFFMQAPAGICILDGPDLVFELVNPGYQQLFSGRRLLDRPLLEAVPEIRDQPIWEILQKVYLTGETYEGNELLIPLSRRDDGPIEQRYFNFIYQARLDENDQPDGILVFVTEVTGMVRVQQDQLVLNAKLTATNEEEQAANEELTAANESLLAVQQELQNQTEEKQRAIDSLSATEQNIRSMVRQAPVGMCIVQGDPLFMVEINEAFLEIIGKTREEIKKPYWEVVPEAEAYYRPITESVFATGETYHAKEHEIMLIRNGRKEIVHIDFVYEPMKDSAGKTYAIMIVAIDITDKVLARRKVERAEESLRMAIDAAGLGTYYINVIDRIFYPSEKLKEFFGFGPDEEVPYEAAINQIHPDYRKAAADLVEAAITTGVKFDMEYPIIGHRDGKIRWVRGIGTVQQDEKGINRYFTGVLHEITEQKQDEIRKNDFIGMVSHELKTPLTSLTAIIQVANIKLKSNEDGFLTGAMEKANIQVKRMSNIINGFLNISRLESAKLSIDKHEFNLDELIEDVVKETALTVYSHTVEFQPCNHILVNADQDKIRSVVTNLISNAVKYSPKGKVVGIKCEIIEGSVQVSVRDDGMGLKSQDKDKVFDRYFRVESNHTQHIAGFGIGLYLSAEIIRHHDGKIWVESDSGKGSTFYFSLPLMVK